MKEYSKNIQYGIKMTELTSFVSKKVEIIEFLKSNIVSTLKNTNYEQ